MDLESVIGLLGSIESTWSQQLWIISVFSVASFSCVGAGRVRFNQDDVLPNEYEMRKGKGKNVYPKVIAMVDHGF